MKFIYLVILSQADTVKSVSLIPAIFQGINNIININSVTKAQSRLNPRDEMIDCNLML
jgi:hypothetical protein